MNKVNLSLVIALAISLITTSNVLIEKYNAQENHYEYLSQELANAKEFTLEVMQNMPAEDYGFKPVDEVRTFRAQAFHIAYSLEWFNAQLSGNPIAWEPGDEDRLEKDAVIEYTEKQFDAFINIINTAEESGQFTSGILGALRHNSHHRGQMVVYYRANGIAPPLYR
jgi:uncharacterized damage-inducible protein DinB